jgi:5-formyltetrahydrofolate cyclo-ligase
MAGAPPSGSPRQVRRVIQSSKSALRAEALARRDALEIDDRLEWDQAIAEHVLALPELADFSGVAAGYWPMRSEVDARPILVGLAANSVVTALPAVVEGKLQFRRWTPWETIVPGGFGTLVPTPDAEVVRPALLVVPLACFDRSRMRMGYGKGHYDTAIAALAPVITIGVAYAAQEVGQVPQEAHDRRLDIVVTERGVLRA